MIKRGELRRRTNRNALSSSTVRALRAPPSRGCFRCVGHDPNVCVPVKDVIVCDTRGAIHRDRKDLTPEKRDLLRYTNRDNRVGSVQEVLAGVAYRRQQGKSAHGSGRADDEFQSDRVGNGEPHTGDRS